MIELRDYQAKAVDDLIELINDGDRKRGVILSSPTGSGKTEMAIETIRRLSESGLTCEFIADRQNLVRQTSGRFSNAGVKHGVLMGSESVNLSEPIRICSAQTIASRGLQRKMFNGLFESVDVYSDVYMIDECHVLHRKVLDMIADSGSVLVGLTATPFPEDLPRYYSDMVNVTTTRKLIGEEHLCPFKVVLPVSEVDVEGLKVKSGGEWGKEDVGDRVMNVVGDIVPEWEKQVELQFGGVPQSTIAFGASVNDCEMLSKRFNEAGYKFEVVSYRNTNEDNQKVINRFRDGEILGVVNCATLSRGSDFPRASILVDAYPLRKSFTELIQRYGRVLRTFEGKEFALIIDHAGNWMGFYDQIHMFYAFGPAELGDAEMAKATRKKSKKSDKLKDKRVRSCRKCGTAWAADEETCLVCGAPRPKPKKKVESLVNMKYEFVEGRLDLFDEITGDTFSHDVNMWREICTYAKKQVPKDRGRAMRRAKATYKTLTGKWPSWNAKFKPYKRDPDPVIEAIATRSFNMWLNDQRRKSYARRNVA